MAEDLERLVVSLSADIKSYENALAKASGITRKQMQEIKKEASGVETATVVAFQRANRGVQEFANGAQGVERNISGFRTQVQQAAFQIGDFAVQVAGGTKATTALAQQLPQLLGAFGTMGAILGAGVAVGIPLITAAFAAMGDQAIPLSERVKTLSEALNAVKDAAELQASSIDDLTKKYGEADAAVQKLIASTVQQALLEATQQVRELSSAFAEFTDRTRDFGSGTGNRPLDPLNFGLQEIIRTFDVTEEQARRLQDAFQGVRDAASQGPDAAFKSLVNLLQVLQSSTDDTGALSGALTETSKTVRDLADTMGQVRGAVDDVTTGVDAITAATGTAVNAAVGLADAWGRVAQSSAVAAQMASAAANAAGARSAPGTFTTTSPTSPSTSPSDYPTFTPAPTAADFPTFGFGAPVKVSGGSRGGGGSGGVSDAAKAAIEEQKLVGNAVKDAIRDVARAQEELQRENERTADSLADVFVAGIDGAGSLEDALKSLAQQVARTFITRGFESLLSAGGGTGILGSIGSLLSGARASGGPVAAGGRYLVGERGPEIFVPSSSGTIVPNGGSGRIMIDLGPDLEARFMDGAARQSVQISRAESNKVRRDVPRLTEQAQKRFS